MTILGKVLLVDDEKDALSSLMRALSSFLKGVELYAAHSADDAVSLAKKHRISAAVVDLDLGHGVKDGHALIAEVKLLDPTIHIIVLTGNSSDTDGSFAVANGAAYFVSKPANIPELSALLQHGIRTAQFKRSSTVRVSRPGNDLVGSSDAMKAFQEELSISAESPLPVLLIGETGTGKTAAARLLHDLSYRAPKRLVEFYSAECPADLVQTTLFGKKKGAFNG